MQGLANAWGGSEVPGLGDRWNDTVDFYFNQEQLPDLEPTSRWYPPSIFFQGMKFTVFGDPALRLPK